MVKTLVIKVAILLVVFFGVSFGVAQKAYADDNVHYVTFVMTNIPMQDIETNIQRLKQTFGEINPNSRNMYAFGFFGPMILTQSADDCANTVNKLLDLAEQYNVPVHFRVDDIDNLPPSGQPITADKLYSNDPDMVEWTNWQGYTAGYWFNWGSWMKTGNFPCLASQSYQQLVRDRLQTGVVNPIVSRLSVWAGQGKSYLFAGVSVGSEEHFLDLSVTGATGYDPNNPPVYLSNYYKSTAHTPRSAIQSSSDYSDNWTAANIIDSNSSTAWMSASHSSEANTESITLDMGSVLSEINGVTLKAGSSSFPKDFKFQYSRNGTNYTDIPNASYIDFCQPETGTVMTFGISDVSARYIKLVATKLRYDANHNYTAQIAEFNVITQIGYKLTPRAAATASSYVNSYNTPDMAIDGNNGTGWISAGQTESTNAQALILDLGAIYDNIGKVSTVGSELYPQDFVIQYSTDGINYADVEAQSYTNYAEPMSGSVQDFKFNRPVTARYIAIVATKLRISNGLYYARIMEINAHILANYSPVPRNSYSADASTEYNSNWTAVKAIDGDDTTGWSSAAQMNDTGAQWLKLDLGTNVNNVGGVKLTARGCLFPVDFKFQYSTDGINFLDIYNQSYTNYVNPIAYETKKFLFDKPVTARYIRLYVTKFRQDDINGNYWAQIMEMGILTAGACPVAPSISAAASSYVNNDWVASNAVDNNPNTGWSSANQGGQTANCSLTLDMGAIYPEVGTIKFLPRGGCFPIDFKLQYSKDGTNFTDIPSCSFTNYPQPAQNAWQTFTFQNPLEARYIRVSATKVSYDGSTGWYAQIMEMRAEVGQVMQSQEMAQSGYHSLSYLGYTEASLAAEAAAHGQTVEQYTRFKLFQIQHDYTQANCKLFYDAGIPRYKISTHIVSLSTYSNHNTTNVPPVWTAVNPYSVPGFTMSPVTCPYVFANMWAEIQLSDPDISNFVVSEGYAAGIVSEVQGDVYLNEMFNQGATNVTILGYCYDEPSKMFFVSKDPNYGFNRSIAKWMRSGVTASAVPRSSITASSQFSTDWAAIKAIDGNNATGWSSAAQANETDTQWLTLDMGTMINNVGIVSVTSRGTLFPVELKFQYSTDGTTFYDIPGTNFTNSTNYCGLTDFTYYPQPGINENRYFRFNTPVNARYIRLYVPRLRHDDVNGNYWTQVMEINAYSVS